ncbi:alpha/beta fold hydrolase [Streptomyces sp. MUM 2J]|uniref:thioesterase domain-containing protein n=1 Tax=Streptomyces sp. MUM 2J TaxID=2791987 RepID=UPI001F0503A4|nr:alpha/beta fold hydrolase [Streptomyces sp. MUM 2J]MCH0566159.1 alpha/beta fold hydrolase [Streptomyces sp. MUM 2J]
MEEHLVALRGEGTSALVFVHPASGMATAFRRLLPQLEGDYQVLAFENAGPASTELCSVGRLSARYTDELMSYGIEHVVLAGWSFGGSVAVDMAARLEAAGRKVSGIVLIDSGCPTILDRAERTLGDELAGLFEFSSTEELELGPAPSEEETWAAVLRVLRDRYRLPSLTRADLEPFLSAFTWHLEAIRAPWTPPRPTVPMFQIRARHETGWGAVPADLGWTAALGVPVQVTEAPGNHYSMLNTDHAAEFGTVLTTCLECLEWPK